MALAPFDMEGVKTVRQSKRMQTDDPFMEGEDAK